MCGILGVYREHGLGEKDVSAAGRALSELRFRGPDGQGTWSSEKIFIGHTRLSILDPESGQQPWRDARSGLVLSYNGELYNHLELRRELEEKGYGFQTRCDTEVLCFAFLEWGEACLHRLRGMFAFAVFDPRCRRLWLVRDRLGVKPLYYHPSTGGLEFASSLAAILQMLPEGPRWWPPAVAHYLMTSRPELGRETVYASIYNVEPGTFLRIDLDTGAQEIESYWSLPRVAPEDKPQEAMDVAAGRVRELLDESFQEQHLSSDVPVGAFLSGGIDSAILCASVQGAGAALTAYSIGYERDNYNEWAAMKTTARRCGLNWTCIAAREETFWEDCEQLIAHRGGPLTTPNEVPIYRMAEAFGRDCKVTLTGEGADEMFGGYAGPGFCAYDYDRSLGLSGGISQPALLRAYNRSQFASRCEHFLLANSWFQKSELLQMFPAFAREGRGIPAVEAWYRRIFDATSELSTFDAYLQVHARVNLEALLNRLDSSTMRASVEGRVPFTDHRLAEYVFTLPDEMKMGLSPGRSLAQHRSMNAFEMDQAGHVETKRLLRRAFAPRIHPEILQRRKVSFPVPFFELLTGAEQPRLQELLQSAPGLNALLREGGELKDAIGAAGPKAPMLSWLLMNLALVEKQWGVR
ncbi:MAG: asparagine synthase (glutamine-hydrolyzing) [Opitutales bacterium]